jgi:hypothetical protein
LKVLAQPAQSLTDLVLGLVVIRFAVLTGRAPEASRHWSRSFWWAGAAALSGAVHHAVFVRWEPQQRISWSLISLMVVVAVSYLLAATVEEVLGPRHYRIFWVLRSVGLAAYVVVIAAGHAGTQWMLACESLTMVSVLALWALAAYRGHPLARNVILAILASMAAALTAGLDPVVTGVLRLDPTSVYHIAQIGGMTLLFHAVNPRGAEPARTGGRRSQTASPI